MRNPELGLNITPQEVGRDEATEEAHPFTTSLKQRTEFALAMAILLPGGVGGGMGHTAVLTNDQELAKAGIALGTYTFLAAAAIYTLPKLADFARKKIAEAYFAVNREVHPHK